MSKLSHAGKEVAPLEVIIHGDYFSVIASIIISSDSSGILPPPGGPPSGPVTREASWTAVVLYERDEVEDEVSPFVHFTCAVKAPEDWRSPRPRGLPTTLAGRPMPE